MATPARALTTRRRGRNDDRRIANSPFGARANQGAGGHNGHVPVEIRGTDEPDGSVREDYKGAGMETGALPVGAGVHRVSSLGGNVATQLLRRRGELKKLAGKYQVPAKPSYN